MIRELGLGTLLGLIIIFISQGYNILPFLFLGVLGFFIWQILSQEGAGGIAGLTSNKDEKTIPVIDFKDIGGQDTAKKELIEALEFLKDLPGVKKMGIRAIKGILLSGPPGTGKTLLAKAAAHYTDSIFLAASGSEFIEMYAGLGAKRVRNLFKNGRNLARKNNKKSVIIFIDEIDVLGGTRGQVSSHMEYDQTLNQLLVEMDGLSMDDEIQILLMAATNRIDVLDPALLRPGRFDRIVNVDLPDKEGRLSILKIHAANKPLGDDVDLAEIAGETYGFSGAHLENLTNEAAIFALRENSPLITSKHFMEAIDKVMMGEKLDRKPVKEDLERVAVHETGHALIAEIMNPGSVSTITISPRGKALGYVRQNPADDLYLQTKGYLENQISIAIAGSIAEEILLGSKSTGASNDFKQAIQLVKIIIEAGMSSLGVVDKDSIPDNILHQEITKILRQIEEEVKKIIIKHQDLIKKITEELLIQESFSGKELRELIVKEKAACRAC
ncbi:MAG TPA: AAA family ATPase [Halanaerobiaceae bacterium]|jgi:ATP-dependent metalloprotease FtsH|nr:AAA family ATPase [Halanaerobiaceae bacterium]HOA41010.1 AAA family ATPase [Halanaerobiales bacterium]HPZ63943.1 AAA family ATPase [Halanaerobiales bacterium]